MDVNRILLDILVVLLAAKLAAELADRVRLPAVVGEIAAGVIIGPSVLGLVHNSQALQTLAELGVILLLLEVGLEMDLGELGSVGRASLLVAVAGVVVPMVTGAGAGLAMGMNGKEALFVGAALTATSVGITARVFGDLRALASVEARTVLGAAVADDVLGLIILTVVTRIVTQGSVSPLGLAWVIAVAVGFVVITTLVGVRLVPPAFAFIRRYSRSAGTLVAIALAFTLAVSELAHAAQLAPIVGAFVAGIALARSSAAHTVRKELSPVGHLLIPVFFLSIGIDADVAQFARPAVLGIAGVLLVVAVLGKLASVVGLVGSPADRMLVGIGMIPRGEVGLIFATLGLRQGVFGEDIYAALLLVVLVTTVGTPPALRARLLQLRARKRAAATADVPIGEASLRISASDEIEMVGEPLPGDALRFALDIARMSEQHPIGPSVFEWLDAFPPGPRRWDAPAVDALWRLLHEGGPKSWRLLSRTGVLQRALPEIDDALANKHVDAFDIDPLHVLRFPRLAAVRRVLASGESDAGAGDAALLAALVLDATDESDADAAVVARRTVQRLALGSTIETLTASIIGDAGLLPAALHQIDALGEESVVHIAVHLETVERADALCFFARATFDGNEWERERLDALCDLIRTTLRRPDLVDRGAMYEVERRRNAAADVSLRAPVRERIFSAPRDYVLVQSPDDIIRHAQLCEPAPRRGEVRVRIDALDKSNAFRIEIAAADRVGLIARTTRALADARCSVESALATTWGDGTALASYRVTAPAEPDEDDLAQHLGALLAQPLAAPGAPGVELDFDDDGSPWYTRCIVSGCDRAELLRTLTTAFATASVSVHSATISTDRSQVRDVFDLSTLNGQKLDQATKRRIAEAIEQGVVPARRGLSRLRRRNHDNAEALSARRG